jgi:hypothetical protein
MSDKLDQIIKTALIAGYKPKPIPMRTESIENVIRKALFEQDTQGTRSTDPMAHLRAAAGKSIPDISLFDKELAKIKPEPKYANPAYDSKSLGMEPTSDFASMNAELGVNISIAPAWKNSTVYNYLISLGGRPFIASTQKTGTVDQIPIGGKDIQTYIIDDNNPSFFGQIFRGVQLPMYNHPNVNAGAFVYFYENPNHMYFSYVVYGKHRYLDWEYETARTTTTEDGTKVTIGGKLWLVQGGTRKGFLGKSSGTGAVIFIKSTDPMLRNPAKSDYIQTLRNVTGIESLFKSNKPTIVNIFGYDFNLTALADRIQAGFDWVGILIPPIDIINAAWYMGRGRYFEACLSMIALIPGLGDATAIVFKTAWRATAGVGKFTMKFVEELFRLSRSARIPDSIIVKSLEKCKQFVESARKTGIISDKTYNEMITFLDDGAGLVQEYLMKRTPAKQLAKNKSLQKKLSNRLGLDVVDDAAEAGVAGAKNIFARYFGKLGASGYKVLQNVLTAGGKTAYSWLSKRSINYWKAAYTMAFKQFKKVLIDPKRLTLCIYSFTNSKLRDEFAKKAVDLLIAAVGQPTSINGVMKYSIRYVDDAGRAVNFRLSRAELESVASTQLVKIVNAIKQNSLTKYNELLDDVVSQSAKIGESVNGYWTAFWTDPMRRFLNENFKLGRLKSLRVPTDTGASTVRNVTSDIFDGLKQLFTTQDFLKRIDIVYNELQEFFERKDYGTKPGVDPSTGKETIPGKDFNQQSVVYYMLDESWHAIFGKYITDTLDDADKAIQTISPSAQHVEKVYREGMMQGDIDSLNFQGWLSTKPGGRDVKLAWMKKLVEAKPPIAKYLGKFGSVWKWKILRTSDADNVTEGEIITIDKRSVMAKEQPWETKKL